MTILGFADPDQFLGSVYTDNVWVSWLVGGVCKEIVLFNRVVGASLVDKTVKNLPAMQETWVQSLGWEDSWKREWQPTPVFLPGEFHGQRSLVGCIPWGHRAGHDWATNTFQKSCRGSSAWSSVMTSRGGMEGVERRLKREGIYGSM